MRQVLHYNGLLMVGDAEGIIVLGMVLWKLGGMIGVCIARAQTYHFPNVLCF